MTTNETLQGTRWLLLIHQLPAKPAYARVKVWRRLQALGAVTVKGAVYALPVMRDRRGLRLACQGDRRAVARRSSARRPGRRTVDRELQALFDAARDEDYRRIAAEAREVASRLGDDLPDNALAEIASQTARLRKQLDAVVAIDFFGADEREPAEGLVSGLEARLQQEDKAMAERTDAGPAAANAPAGLKGRVWVTRQGVQIDRIASAWLIRRFVDDGARFKFVPGTGYAALAGELRFDMFEGEYTHRGDRCTFEVLLTEAGLDDPALTAIGEIIHDIDLKDGKYGREEAAGIRNLIAGIASSHNDDNALERRRRSRRSLPVFCQQAAHQMNKQTTGHGVPFDEAMKVWARVAALSFGGPAGQIAVMHRIIVEEKRWIGENRFLQALNYCTLLPGPEAQQLAIYIGWLMHRTKGGLFAGTLFVLPGLIAIMALSWIYVLLGKLTIVEGLFFGLKAAVLVVVVERCWRRQRAPNNVMVLGGGLFVAIASSTCGFHHLCVFGAGGPSATTLPGAPAGATTCRGGRLARSAPSGCLGALRYGRGVTPSVRGGRRRRPAGG
jgi:chromate transport protein ChrA